MTQPLTAEELDSMIDETVYRAMFGRGVDETLKALGLPDDSVTLLNINDYAFKALSQTYKLGTGAINAIGSLSTYAEQMVFLGRMEALAKQAAQHWRAEAKKAGVKFLSLDPRSDWFKP